MVSGYSFVSLLLFFLLNGKSFVIQKRSITIAGNEIHIKGKLLVAKDKPYNLTCETSNNSFSNITWFKDGRLISVSGKYYAGIADLHNAGIYVCQATFSNYVTAASSSGILRVASKSLDLFFILSIVRKTFNST